MSALQAISPLDGRYASKTAPLAAYSSESALIRYRVRIEVEYLIALTQAIPALSKALPEPKQEALRKLYKEWSTEAAQEVKDIEATTNHDVKAVEYYIKRHLPQLGLEEIEEFVHFGLTSQDVNNTAFPLMLREALHEVYLPTLHKLIGALAIHHVKKGVVERTHVGVDLFLSSPMSGTMSLCWLAHMVSPLAPHVWARRLWSSSTAWSSRPKL